ncbi:MAG: helix-turn-helix transcriptional regulator [Armatimonadetes bacterium]|nr:helix-turn-helix transcriptional regulator [Armatimonadota bacterium]
MELGILLSGDHECHLEERTIATGPGDVWLVGTWEPHRWRCRSPHTRQLSVVFIPEFIPEEVLRGDMWQPMFACHPRYRPNTTGETRAVAIALGEEIACECEEQREGWQAAIRLLVARLLLLLAREWSPPANARRTRHVPSSSYRRIQPALASLHAEPAKRLSLEDAAALCGLSSAHFARIFVHTTGISFGRFRTRAHLALAAHHLLRSDVSIEGVAGLSGFTDASHLHRQFLRAYGVSPGRYRELNR